MLRLAVWLAIVVLSAGPACADAPAGMPIEAAWFRGAADALAQAGPYGVIVILGFVIRALWQTIAARDDMIAGLQDKRAADASASAERLATVATTGSAAIAGNSSGLAELTNRMQSFAEVVRPLGPEHGRIIAGLDRNGDKIDDLTKTVGSGCRA